MKHSAKRSSKRQYIVAVLLAISLGSWAVRHGLHTIAVGSLWSYLYTNWLFVFSFFTMGATLILASREKPYPASDQTDSLHVSVVVPAYNEDPEALKECIESILTQSRAVQSIYIVDDGSKDPYEDVRTWFKRRTKHMPIQAEWIIKVNGGKRSAQALAFRANHHADIFVTVDSDSILDHHATEELLRPFADKSIQSVAGVVLAKNNRANVLARITDLLFVCGQLIDRSAMSSVGSVLVNSGGLAAYRAEIIRDNLDAYLGETFFGHKIEFSDDSMLTLFALERGKTVQQPTAFVFTMMPERVSHHIRQQIRWMKGSFIRSWWRLRYLPLTSFGFMRQVISWGQFSMTTMLLVLLIITRPDVITTNAGPILLLAPLAVGYIQGLRYMSIQRNDESFQSQFLTYLLAPFAVVWAYAVLRPIRLYAIAQCLRNEWGTRTKVEVTLASNKRLTLSERILAIRRYQFYRETLYERLASELQRAHVTFDEATEVWHSLYNQLTNDQKWALWHDYELLTSHITNSQSRYIKLPRLI